MEISIFVAKIIALIYIPLGIAMLVGQIKAKELIASFEKSPAMQMTTGYLGVIMGIFLITYHNVWVLDWPVLITVLGWVAIVECVLILALPKTIFAWANGISTKEKLWGSFALIFGLIFAYFGFIA